MLLVLGMEDYQIDLDLWKITALVGRPRGIILKYNIESIYNKISIKST